MKVTTTSSYLQVRRRSSQTDAKQVRLPARENSDVILASASGEQCAPVSSHTALINTKHIGFGLNADYNTSALD